MTARDVFLPVGAQPSIDTFPAFAQQAESLGYDRVWLPESWGREAATVLALIAERTDHIGVGASILNVYSRSPALLGQLAATQQEAADGRFRLGLGPSGPAVIEHWHGQAFEDPLRHTREAVDIVKAVLTGRPVTYEGAHYQLQGFRLRCDPPDPVPPVDAAGLGPKAVELAGRVADGWQATSFTPAGMRTRLEDFERGLDLGGRRQDDARVTLSVTTCALEEADRAKSLVAQHLAFYLGGMGTFYRDNLARQGHTELAERIHEAWQAGEQEHATAIVREELLSTMGAAGSPAEVRDRLATYEGIDGVDAVNIACPRGASEADITETLTALAPNA